MDSLSDRPRPSPNKLLSSFRPNRMRNSQHNPTKIPHQGALCRLDDDLDTAYMIEIALDDEQQGSHELNFTRKDFEFTQRLFAILDNESRGLVDRASVKEFVTLRCPVFWRRDEDLRRLNLSSSERSDSPTFDEIWKSVAFCSKIIQKALEGDDESKLYELELGIEGWMVFCRFIALAQYLEAKRRFSARHLQQTMRHRNSPRGSEVVVVDVPPLEPPAALSPQQLANYEEKSKSPLPLPELDLDHSLVAAHDVMRRRPTSSNQGIVKISLFGQSFSSSLLHSTSVSSSSSSNLEFAVTYMRTPSMMDSSSSGTAEETVVRRSMADMKWLNDTFTSHKVLGGTLCGRILPPFPGTSSRTLSHFHGEDSVLSSTTGGAITAAAASVGRIRNAAKSFFGTYLNNSNTSVAATGSEEATAHPAAAAKKLSSTKKPGVNRVLPESYYNPNSPEGRARHLERYLNYLLEHPALSTSFPLNTILKASQSGLEAAKESLEECTRATKELKDQTPQLDDGKIAIPFWPSSSGSSDSTSISPNLAWVRTAAQAAMALKVHGMLETTGLNTASARLQHASLPSFGTSTRSSGWEDDEGGTHQSPQDSSLEAVNDNTSNAVPESNNFEEGVVSVQSELQSEEQVIGDEGYDLLPLPVPAPERSILSAGSDANSANITREARFHYGSAAAIQGRFAVDDSEEESRDAFLGEISVDDNIDKLREVIGSVDNTLSRCLASVGGIGKAQKERQALHLEVVRGLDSWAGMRGKFISERSLLKGVAGIEHSKDIYEEGDVSLIDDLSWQTSLANSAVAAAEDVRSAVRVSRTAASAKAAASSAAFAAQNACETGTFANIDEARAAQTRASIAQSHAIHAAVVEHEAKTVKRRATLALANDVKCWNVHRKREMLHSCVTYARSQHEATRRAVDAWSSLRDGFIGTTMIPSAHERRPVASPHYGSSSASVSEPLQPPVWDQSEVTATIYQDVAFADNSSSGDAEDPAIVAVEHNILSAPPAASAAPEDEQENVAETPSEDLFKAADPFFESPDLILPFATASPIPEEDEDLGASLSGHKDDTPATAAEQQDTTEEEILSASMQSLVDGLMTWGGGIDTEEDHFALPAGMAASIAFEETNSTLGTRTNLS